MSSRALPESCSRLIPLFRGDLIAIDDWFCAGHDTPGRHEEWSDDDRIVVTRRGLWELEVEGDARLADPLTAMLWNGERGYRVRHPIGGGDQCTVFRLTARGAELFRAHPARAESRTANGTFVNRSRSIDGRSYMAHRRTLTHARRLHASADPLAIEEPALEFLRRMTDDVSGDTRACHSRETRRYVDHASAIIARDFRRPLTIDCIAREAHCSPFHLGRLYRQSTGATLYRAVVRLRLREALERVLDEPEQLSAIALDVGFASHSHFTDAFRSEYGCAPIDARRWDSSRRQHDPNART
jgi:AraC family transcriptional regulator